MEKTMINGLPTDQPTMADGTPYGLTYEQRVAFRNQKKTETGELDPAFFHPDGTRKTFDERVHYRQLQKEARDKLVQAEAEAKRLAAGETPPHLIRPKNYPAIVLAERLRNDRPGNRCPTETIKSLEKAAKEREAQIDRLMEQRLADYERENNPKIKSAIESAELGLLSAQGIENNQDEIDARIVLKVIAAENPDLYYKESSKLYDQRLQRLEALKTQHTIETAEVLATDAKLNEQITEANKGKEVIV